MKNNDLLLQLQDATEKGKIKKEEQNKEAEKKQAERVEKEAQKEGLKRAQRKMKGLNKTLLNTANEGYSEDIIELIWGEHLTNGDGSKPEHWGPYEKELFRLLEEGGYEPQIRKRKNGDRPYAYSEQDVPYVIIVSWEK